MSSWVRMQRSILTADCTVGGAVKHRIVLIVTIALYGGSVAPARTQDGQQACMNDAFQFCQDAIPDRERVFNCLVSRRNVISAACRSAVSPSLPADQPPSERQAQAKHAGGKATWVKRASLTTAASPLKRQTHQAKSAKRKSTIVKHASLTTTPPSPLKRQPAHAKSKKHKSTVARRASNVIARRDRQPLNLLPH